MRRRTTDPAIRFWRFVEKGDGCWKWIGGTSNSGYGYFGIGNGKFTGAHRFSFATFVEPIRKGNCVMHMCDNRLCVRPDHLRQGSLSDNTQDMLRKGRHRTKNATKTECIRGHAFTPENTGAQSGGRRYCKKCQLFRCQRTRARQKQEAA